MRKAGGGVDEQTGVAWRRGNALRQLEEGKAAQKIDKVYLTTAKLPLDRTNPVKKEVRVPLLFCALTEFIPSSNTSFGSLFVHSLRQSCDTNGAH